MYTNKFNVPLPLAVWLVTDEYQYAKYANEISATSLLKSPRYIIASRRAMYPEQFPEELRPIAVTEGVDFPDIQERIAARIGTAIHSSVEQAWKINHKEALKLLGYPEHQIEKVGFDESCPIRVHQEDRLYKTIEVNGQEFVISGQFDMIINGELHDIKTTSTYTYEFGVNDEKYMLQGSIYRWLNPELITGDYLTINFLFLDWKQMFQKKDSYPVARAYSKTYPLLSLADTEAFIRNKLKTVSECWNLPLNLIPCCTEKELFSKPPVYKYYKTGYEEGKRASKVFDTFAEASAYRATEGGFKGDIIENKGEPFMCPFCDPLEVEQMMVQTHKPKQLEIC